MCSWSIVESVAWDWINKKLYFTDQDRQTVEVLDPETGYSKVLVEFDNNIILPRRVIVDPLSRYYTSLHVDRGFFFIRWGHDGTYVHLPYRGKFLWGLFFTD